MPGPGPAPARYRITFSVGTTRHDESRFVVTVPAARLAAKILAIQARPNAWIYAVDIAY